VCPTPRDHRGGRGGRVPPIGDSPGPPPTVRASTPWWRTRLMRGRGVSAVSRSSKPIGSKQERHRAVAPLGLQGEEHSAVGGPRQPLMRDRRPEHMASKLFEAVACRRRRGRWRLAQPGGRSPLTPVHQGARCAVLHSGASCLEPSRVSRWSVAPPAERRRSTDRRAREGQVGGFRILWWQLRGGSNPPLGAGRSQAGRAR
jgi:hypothetical protein